MGIKKKLRNFWKIAMFEFEYPYAFLLLPLFLMAERYCKPKDDALILSGLWLVKTAKKSYLWIFKILGVIFLVISLASPINKKDITSRKEPSHAIMLTIDVSGSMRYGMKKERKIDIAKNIASEFIEKRKDDHIGIMAFGSFAYIVSPLTFDTKASSMVMKKLYLGMSGKKTALIDSLFMSIRILKKAKAKEKIVILLTDGFDKGSRIPKEPFLNALHNEKVRVYTIGIGNPQEYNRAFLKALANEGHGKFYQADDIQSLQKAYKNIDTLEKSELKKEFVTKKIYYYQYPLFLALLFFIIYFYFTIRAKR